MYSFFLKHIILPMGSIFFNGNYTHYLNQWRKYDQMSERELEEVQMKKLKKILRYAMNNVSYYSQLELPENPTIIDFPVLTKDILREQSKALISKKHIAQNLEKNFSSGSSGVQSSTYMTKNHKFYLRALQTHWWMWGGYRPGEKILQTGMSPNRTLAKKLKDFFFRVNYMDAFNLSNLAIKTSLYKLEKIHPKHIAGYPSALNEIALAAIKDRKTYKFNSLISLGDKLFEKHLKNFSIAFQSPIIINTYGCAEGYLMACSVDYPYYYIMSPHVFLEIVDDEGNPVKNGEMGHILVTGLTNFAMPLIRYKLGDLGIMLPKEKYPKPTRFNYPLLQQVIGRETDVIKAPNGNILIVHSFTGIFEYYLEVKQFKIIQKAHDKITVEYITENHIPLPENMISTIRHKLNKITGNSMIFTFVQVEHIAPSPSGKPQIIEIRL